MIDRNEGNEEFTLRITHLTRLGATDPQPPIDVTIKIIDNEVPTITLSNSTFEVAENDQMGGNFIVNFQLSGETGSLVTFDYALNGITATNVTDFTTPTDPITIPIGMTTTALTIPIIVDAENEGNETFTLAISNLMGAAATDGTNAFSQEITIVDDEDPTIRFDQTDIEVAELGGTAEIVVNLSGATASAVTFTYYTEDDSANTTNDFMGIASESAQTGTIAIGSTSTTLRIPIIDDLANEGNEEFKVKISSAMNAVFADSASSIEAVVTIVDNEVPILSLSNSVLSPAFEVMEDVTGGNFIINFNLSGATGEVVTLDYSFVNGTTTSTDFTAPTTPLTIAVGSTTQTLTIPINNDEIHEGEETFTLALTNLVGAVFADGSNAFSQVITIADNETPTLKFAQTTLDVAESVGMAEVIVNLSGATNNPVVITYETVDGTAVSPADFTGITNASPAMETIAIGDTTTTLRIPIIEDIDAEGNQDFKVKITNASNSVFPESAGFIEATVTIIDNEVPTLTVAESTRSVAEDIQNGRFQVTFELSYDAIENVTFDYRLEGITALKDTDFMEPTNRAESISVNSDETSITIQITPDDMNEGDETFKIVVTDITNAVSSTGLTTFEQIITITDDEMPTLSISNSSFEVAEDVAGGNFIIDYALSGATQTVVSFNYTLTASTATAGSDYTVPDSLTETIAIGNTSGMITIAIDDDDMNEGNETFTIAIMGLTGALFSDKTTSLTQEITIVDDELPAIEVVSTNIEVDEDVAGRMVNVVVNLAGPTKNPVVIGYETINGTAESPSDFTGFSKFQ